MDSLRRFLAAALFLAYFSDCSWAANPPWDTRIQFTRSELAQAEGECDKGTADFRNFYARFLGRPFEDNLIGAAQGDKPGWHAYAQSLACLDLAGDPKWSCGFLAPAKGKSANPWLDCQELRAFPLFARAILRGGDPKEVFPQVLEKFFGPDAASFPAASKERLLQGLSKAIKTRDIQSLCAEMMALKPGADYSMCASWAGFLSGDPRQCASAKEKNQRDDCIGRMGVLEALKSQDPKACSSHLLCDVMTKRQPALCAPLVKEANAVFCGAVRALTKGKAPPPVDTAKKDREEKLAKEKALREEAARKEKERVAEFHRKRIEEEKKTVEKAISTDYRVSQEIAARKRERDEEARRAREERNRRKQFQPGQRMDLGPREAMEQIGTVNSGKPLPRAEEAPPKEIKDE